MGETLKIENFPAGKVGVARETLAKLSDRLTKAATKAGATAPASPSLTVENERTVYGCCKCSASSVGGPTSVGKDCGFCDGGYIVEEALVDLLVDADRPALAGWEFLAVVEPLEGGNMVRRVPGSDESFDLTAYRSGDALSCEHCDTVRRRTETFVVKSDGTDPLVPAGVVKRVGRNCLASFLGGLSPAALLARLTWEKVLRDIGEEGGGGGSTERTFSPVTFLEWTCGMVRARGWVSKSAAAAYEAASGGEAGKVPTVSRVLSMFERPPSDPYARSAWLDLRAEATPTDDDKAKAPKVLEWAMNLTGGTDYEYNLSLVARQSTLEPKNAGLFASAVGSYDRAMGLAAKKAAEKLDKVPAPTGKGIEFEGEVISTKVTEGQWGVSEKMTVKVTTPEGTWLAWCTIPADLLRTHYEVDGYKTYDTADHTTLVGRKVAVKATLEPGKDAFFVFAKRPAVEFADVVNHPVFVAPKAPRKPRAKKVAPDSYEGFCAMWAEIGNRRVLYGV